MGNHFNSYTKVNITDGKINFYSVPKVNINSNVTGIYNRNYSVIK